MNAPNELPDLSALWMPFTANRAFKTKPRLLAGASGNREEQIEVERRGARRSDPACAGRPAS